jgi:Class II Aldolase and Adducin N-terminal domain
VAGNVAGYSGKLLPGKGAPRCIRELGEYRGETRGGFQMTRTAKPKGLVMEEAPPAGGRVIPISNEERYARERLAVCYRIFNYLGWTESIFNHITLRIPGPETTFLINPFGLRYCEVTASNLIAIDIHGHPVRPAAYPVNLAGFVTHERFGLSLIAALSLILVGSWTAARRA